jgi:hypothetical protein
MLLVNVSVNFIHAAVWHSEFNGLSNRNFVRRFWRIRKLWQGALFSPRGRDVVYKTH